MDINEWIAAGKPLQTAMEGMGWNTRPVQRPPPGKWGVACYCDPVKELQATVANKEAWFQACPQCRPGTEALKGTAYSPGTQAFVGAGATLPDARILTPAVPPKAPIATAPAPQNVQPGGSSLMATRTASLALAGLGTAVGGPVGGIVGSVLGSLNLGGSKCPGPYNYDPASGSCVPKPDYAARMAGRGEYASSPGTNYPGYGGGMTLVGSGQCQSGFRWDGEKCVQTGIGGFVERLLPGGETGTQVDLYGNAVVDPISGRAALVPMQAGVVAKKDGSTGPIYRCPPGAVLNKRNLCVDRRSISNRDRKWPKAPAPPMSAQDVKALRRINTLQNKAKKLAQKSGFTCRKK